MAGRVPADPVARAADLAPPEPGLTGEELVRRASALVPALRERAEECERLGRIPDASVSDFLEAGFFRMLQPRRFGGYECDLDSFVRAMSEISRGCPSSGWVLSLTAGHSPKWAGFYPEKTQLELYGDDGDLRFPLIIAPQGRAAPVAGGMRVDGRWNYASGCDMTHWLAVNAIVAGEQDRHVSCLVRHEEYVVFDNWQVVGMQGTGSKQAVLEGVFVPSHRVLELAPPFDEPAQPAPVHDGPFYRGPMTPVFAAELGAVIVGIGRAALDLFAGWADSKTSPFPPFGRLVEAPTVHVRVGRALGRVDAAEAVVLGFAREYMERARQESPIDSAEIPRFVTGVQQALAMVIEALDLLLPVAGTSSAKRGQPLARLVGDLATVRTHALLAGDRMAEIVGRVRLGLPPSDLP